MSYEARIDFSCFPSSFTRGYVGGLVTARLVEPGDAPLFDKMFLDPEIRKYSNYTQARRYFTFRQLMIGIIESQDNGYTFTYMIEPANYGEQVESNPLGYFRVSHYSGGSRGVELDTALTEYARGRGIVNGTYGFLEDRLRLAGVERAVAMVHPSNTASASSLEGMGFSKKGFDSVRRHDRWERVLEG